MSEKKMVSRNVVLTLGIICVILTAFLAYFSITGVSAQNSYSNLQNQNKQLQTWLDGNVTYYSSQITNLQSQLSGFAKPILGFFNLTATDNRTNPETPYLHINGTVHNFGTEGTTGRIDVEAYQSGYLAIQSSIVFLDAFFVRATVNVDWNFPYNGSALTSWTIAVSTTVT